MRRTVLPIILSLAPLAVQAQSLTGAQFAQMCTDEPTILHPYVLGVSDGLRAGFAPGAEEFCITPGTPLREVTAAACAAAAPQPDPAATAAALIRRGLAEAYPCGD